MSSQDQQSPPCPASITRVAEEAASKLWLRIMADVKGQRAGIVEANVQLRSGEYLEAIQLFSKSGSTPFKEAFAEQAFGQVLLVPQQLDVDGSPLGFIWTETPEEWEIDAFLENDGEDLLVRLIGMKVDASRK